MIVLKISVITLIITFILTVACLIAALKITMSDLLSNIVRWLLIIYMVSCFMVIVSGLTVLL